MFRRVASSAPAATLLAAQMRKSSAQAVAPNVDLLPLESDESVAKQNGTTMNMLQAINSAMDHTLAREPKSCIFGEDVAFGGVFRCTLDLRDKYGADRVFNSPLCEQGIAGFAIGMAAAGWKPIAEIQFADYIFPAFDQLVNEAAKYRYRSGGQFDVGGLVVRSPCSAVGHGGLYHSQSVEGYFAHTPGLKVVMPSTPAEAKGLLLQCVAEPDPCIFLEPKVGYRTQMEEVNPDYYTLPIGKARKVVEGSDLTIVAYGMQVLTSLKAINALKEKGVNAELIDLRSILPWDRETVYESVKKTGRVIVTHEAQKTCGFGAEIVSSITSDCFLHLEAPPTRVAGLDTPFPLHERLYLPNEHKLVEAALKLVNY